MDSEHALKIGQELTKSAIFKDYEEAFHELTHLPLRFIPAYQDQPVNDTKAHENPFCQHLHRDQKLCGTCSIMHRILMEKGAEEPYSATCFAGLTETAVPVRLGEEVIGFLQTGQVILDHPEQDDLGQTSKEVLRFGLSLKDEEARKRYFDSPHMSPKQYEAAIKLLEIFATHLSGIVNSAALDKTDEEKEPERVAMARAYIQDHLDEQLSLPRVADAVNTSSFYFSRMFKQVTGHTFTEYLSMVRIEHAKQLMRDQNKNITQIAYDSGFQSLSQFNRVFRKLQHEAPGTYRRRIHNVLLNSHQGS
jgi:AraC-like DNA-binding protein/ligand-binding sensor protein